MRAADHAWTLYVVAVDAAGHPVIRVGSRDSGTPVETFYLDASGHSVVIDQGVQPAQRLDPASAIGDRHGVWFLDFTGRVFLYRPGVGLRQVGFVLPASPNALTEIVGPCS